MPPDLKPKIPRGTITACYSENLMALKLWLRHSGGPPFRGSALGLGLGLTLADLRNGGPESKSRQGDKNKPVVIIDYNWNMGAVDRPYGRSDAVVVPSRA